MVCNIFNKDTRYMQYVATLSGSVFLSCVGMYTSWSSPTIPRLTSDDSPIGVTLTSSEASIVAASFQLGYLPGGILSGLVVSKLGPRSTILTLTCFLCCPWIAIIFAKTILTLCFARFVAGAACSFVATAVPIYNAEVSDKEIRGRLGSAFTTLIIVGNLFVLAVGPFVSYTTLAIICGILPLTYGTIFWFMPESPYFLIKMGKTNAARSSLIRLYGQSTNEQMLEERFEEVTKTIEVDMKNESNFRELFTKPLYRRPLMIMVAVKLIQHGSGVAAIDAYMQTIIKSSKSSISPEHSSIVFGIIQLVAALVAGSLVDRVGRKPLLIVSAVGSAIAMALEGFYFYHYGSTEYSDTADEATWLPITGLILYLIMNPLGLATLFYVLLGEVFPTNIKSRAVSTFTVLYGIFGFIAISLFDLTSKLFGMFVPFYGFAVCSILGAIFIYIVVPETKRKTFIEIQAILAKK